MLMPDVALDANQSGRDTTSFRLMEFEAFNWPTAQDFDYSILEALARHMPQGMKVVPFTVGYFAPVCFLMGAETLMVSPKHLRQYVFPWFKRAADLCKKKGRPCMYHSDGNLYDVIGDLIDCGFNALHPIEPKAMDIAYLKRTVGDKLCLMGNIDLAYTLTLGTPEEVAQETKQRLRDVAPGGGYCVSSSNSVTEYVPLENFNAMRQTALKYGTYPISI